MLVTGIPVSVLLQESDSVLATIADIYTQRNMAAREAKAKARHRSKGK